MKIKKQLWPAFASMTLYLPQAYVQAQADCQLLKAESTLTVNAASTAIGLKLPGATDYAALPDAVSGGKWNVSAAAVQRIREDVGSLTLDKRINVSLRPLNASAMPVGSEIRFYLDNESKDAVCATTITSASGSPSLTPPQIDAPNQRSSVMPATAADCQGISSLPPDVSPGRYVKPLLFNSAGAGCRIPPVLRHGDFLAVGVVVKPGEQIPTELKATFSNCTLETPAPVIYSSGSFDITKQSTDVDLKPETAPQLQTYWLAGQACASDAPQVSIIKGTGAQVLTVAHTLAEYKRYRASVHLGAVYTDRSDPRYTVRTLDGQSVIADESADDKGVEYVGSVVIHGLLHYLDEIRDSNRNSSDPGQWPYKGRDLVNERSSKDLLGLVVSAGLDDPGDRFGIGLSYEIAHGVNLIGLYELVKTKRLDGVSVGDPFIGTADALPKKDHWDKGFSLGITFDISYLTQIFTGRTK